ncbi:transposase [Fimbriimonas ginsengisoli Gsoil 348]|uniref:Transposase n=2 Tax=Fimbriimonas ginsengisoli TaxID=1005039 RepID=A0A068NYV4_FIMGI|nr:transposase [Fimbriimonas ginsengisoli Gsoil 348]
MIVGGVEDHVHILAQLGRSRSQADWAKELKRVSSLWLGEKIPGFHWQSGYGVFSVGTAEIEAVRRYVENQEEHHRRYSFQDELRSLLKEHGRAWDERYLWD